MSQNHEMNFSESEDFASIGDAEYVPETAHKQIKPSGLQGFIDALMAAHRYVQNRRTAASSH